MSAMELSPELRTVPRPQVAFLLLAALVASLMVVAQPIAPLPGPSGAGGAEERAVEGYGNLPISFEPNVGQAPARYDFVARGQGFGMAIDPTGATLALGTEGIVRLDLLGAERAAQPQGLESLPGVVNYFIGDDPLKWHTDVSTFGRVSYRSVLPGIDITYYGTNAGTLEYDFVVAPGADPNDIRVAFSGADDVALRHGRLVLSTAGGAVTQEAPVLYQMIGGRRVPVEGRFSLEGDVVGFEVGAYDHSRSLVIDPTLVYSTFLGGTSDEHALGIAVDGLGSAYVTGFTGSTNFPLKVPAHQGANAGSYDAFVTKLDPAGSALVYSTYLGGSNDDKAEGIAIDETGAAYVTGFTGSTNFPTQAPFQVSNGGGAGGGDDAFITKLNPAGSALIYSTYLGGSGVDSGTEIVVDGAHAMYVTGNTTSTDFPLQAPYQASNAGTTDAFVAKLNDKGSALVYSTYLGGTLDDYAYAIAVDGAGAAHVTGVATSTDFPLQAPFQASNAGSTDAYITKFNPAGSALSYSTYLGGSNDDSGLAIAVDGSGVAYVAGSSTSLTFPTPPSSGSNAGGTDAFITKLNPSGSGPVYSRFLGGASGDTAQGIAVDASGAAYVVGATISTNFPTQAPFQGTNAGSYDAFVAKLNATGLSTLYSTYLGGSGNDFGQGIALDASGNAYVVGYTGSPNFPTKVPFQAANASGGDAFVTKLSDAPPPTCEGLAVTIQAAGPNLTTSGTPGNDVINGTSGIDTINGLGGNDIICGLGGNDGLAGNAGKDTLVGSDGKDTLVGNDGKDILYGEAGDDTLMGGDGNDTLHGDAGNDTLSGNNGDDILYGDAGNDTLNAGLGIGGQTPPDALYGGNGNDTLNGGAFGDKLDGGPGNDKLNGNGAYDKLYGGVGKDTLKGNDGNDHLYGDSDSDTLYGGNGLDYLNGGNGGSNFDVCDGGAPSAGDSGTLCESSTNIP